MAQSAIEVERESDVTSPVDFDNDTLIAKAKDFKNKGNDEYRKKEFSNAVQFYTEGIKVDCKDDELNAQLYNNRATNHFYLGNFRECLNDAEAATKLQPAYIKAIARGASACMELHLYDEAITWCDKGLEINKKSKTLLELRTRSVDGMNKLREKDRQGMKSQTRSDPVHKPRENVANRAEEEKLHAIIKKCYSGSAADFIKYIDYHMKVNKEKEHRSREGPFSHLGNINQSREDVKKAIHWHERDLKAAKVSGDKAREGSACSDLGDRYYSLGDYKKAVYYHDLHLKLAKEEEDKYEEEKAYCRLGNDYDALRDFHKAFDYRELQLKSAKQLGDRAKEARAYGGLGCAFLGLGDVNKAIHYLSLSLKIAKEGKYLDIEQSSNFNLGNGYYRLGDFTKAICYHKRSLDIAKQLGDRVSEGNACRNISMDYQGLRDFKNAIHYDEIYLKIARDIGSKADERKACWGLGDCYRSLANYKKAIYYHELFLENAKKGEDRTEEGVAYCCLGNDFLELGNLRKAIACHEFHLNIAKEIGDRVGEGKACGNLGIAYEGVGDFKKAKDFLELQLKIATKLGDRTQEENAYCGLGDTFRGLGDFKTAIHYHNFHLKMAKERNDRVADGKSYGKLGDCYQKLGDFSNAIDCHNFQLRIASEVGDKAEEALAFYYLGRSYQSLGDFKKAKGYSESCLKIAKEVGNRNREGGAYCNLAITYRSLGDFQKAVEYSKLSLNIAKDSGTKSGELCAYAILGGSYESLVESRKAIVCHEMCLTIAKEIGDRSAEISAYSHLANGYQSLGDFQKSKELRLLSMKMAKDFGYRFDEQISYYRLGCTYESLGDLTEAANCYRLSLRVLNDAVCLQSHDEFKISLRDIHHSMHTSLWQILLKQFKVVEALTAAEQGRAQALKDLMKLKYGFEESSNTLEETVYELSLSQSSSTIYMAYDEKKIVFWVSQNRNTVRFRSKIVMPGDGYHAPNEMTEFFQCLIQAVSEETGVRTGVKCEDRSLDSLRDETVPNESLTKTRSHYSHLEPNALKELHDLIIGPLRDLVHGQELIIVPDGPLFLAPYAAFLDSNSKYLSESFRIRVIPSLTSLKLIADCPDSYHCKTGALLVGDPWVQEFTYQGIKLQQLPCAKEEVEVIGRILNAAPLTGTDATKEAVLQRLSSVALVHIAAHGRMETGEIALAPNPSRKSRTPKEEDYLLTMKDVLGAKLRARLVVLSCCHSGRGEVKSEGVVGIARAFLGAGARSVLVALWAIDDEATLEFMKCFYQDLAKGKSASEALNRAMRSMRQSEKFKEVKYWAPFVLIGDDVTLTFGATD